jgi:AbrB family looped-hinge helix DNA binding protein
MLMFAEGVRIGGRGGEVLFWRWLRSAFFLLISYTYLIAGMLRLKSKLGPKGQAVIPKEIRELMGIRLGSEVVFEVRGDEVVVKALEDQGSVDELMRLIPGELKAKSEVGLKEIILSEAVERWST